MHADPPLQHAASEMERRVIAVTRLGAVCRRNLPRDSGDDAEAPLTSGYSPASSPECLEDSGGVMASLEAKIPTRARRAYTYPRSIVVVAPACSRSARTRALATVGEQQESQCLPVADHRRILALTVRKHHVEALGPIHALDPRGSGSTSGMSLHRLPAMASVGRVRCSCQTSSCESLP